MTIEALLPSGEKIIELKELFGGFSNKIVKVNNYIFRSPLKTMSCERFAQVLEVAKKAFEAGVAPKVVAFNSEKQAMLLEYIPSSPWPSYDQDPAPYKAVMKTLRLFHETMKPLAQGATSYAPFTLVFKESKLEHVPKQFGTAIEKAQRIFEKLKPHIEQTATMCHGDCHKGNVLLSNTPKLIDFDSISVGDPLFDVVKFTLSLPQSSRIELFEEYLGHAPTPEEREHFELIDLMLLMVVVIVRYKSAPVDEKLTREMEELLDSGPLPLFQTFPFKDTSARARQLGATYALSEFLLRSQTYMLSNTA